MVTIYLLRATSHGAQKTKTKILALVFCVFLRVFLYHTEQKCIKTKISESEISLAIAKN